MPRLERVDVGGYTYHVLNRANARVQIFDNNSDYLQFENVLEQAIEKYNMRLLAYCIMPNHWHLMINPVNDGDMRLFMNWLTNTHTRRWHLSKDTVGQGHLYQGRYKSCMCQNDDHFLTMIRYIERNALKANLVRRAEQWRWSSVWRRQYGTHHQKEFLSPMPTDLPHDYLLWLNEPMTQAEEDSLRKSFTKSIPYGDSNWVEDTVKKFGLEQTLRNAGRPMKVRDLNGG